ncbi:MULTISPECIES: DUF4158 domain-containing protein [unclassified Streptomyces]|uniref:DUF4158 domain-containing protein n=1 Tax=unclassified Streptomyces TaxID=2593676 RepID=UPI001C1E7BDA|nr:DUF4158 domain-containing protein [Streptomyces sp. CNQ-509]
MRQEWSPEDVVACWTLVDGDWDLVANKSGPTRLGFCLMLKFFEIKGRFPEFIDEFPQPAVEYVAGLVKVSAAELTKYDPAGREAAPEADPRGTGVPAINRGGRGTADGVAVDGGLPGRAGRGPAAGGPARAVPC